jgi:hypothetical protein
VVKLNTNDLYRLGVGGQELISLLFLCAFDFVQAL